MKKQLLLITTVILFAGMSCEQSIDVEKEKAAIIAVIEEETNAFYARDLDRMNAVYPADGDATHLNATRGGYGYTTDWDGGASFTEFFEANPEPSQNNEVKKNYRIRVYKDAAWASYDNESYNEDGELLVASKHDQFLEKQGGQWKIVFMSILRTTGYDQVAANREMSNLYHELNPEDIENILTDDFIGHFNKQFTWSRDDHYNYQSSNPSLKDTITYQIADGNLVATVFHRTGTMNGRPVQADIMSLKRFEDGKITEIFEYADPSQWQ